MELVMAKRHKSGGQPSMPGARVKFHYNTQHLSLHLLGMDKADGSCWRVFDLAGDGIRARRPVLTAIDFSNGEILAELSNSRPRGLPADAFRLRIRTDLELAIWRGRDFDTVMPEKIQQFAELMSLDIPKLVSLWERTSLCTVTVAATTIMVCDLVADGRTYTIGSDVQPLTDKAA
jgi:hypothetical protein